MTTPTETSATPRPEQAASEPRAPWVDHVHRLVVKIGSSTLASDPEVYARIARILLAQASKGTSVVLVSSGAIALGLRVMGLKTKPTEIAKLQAAAAAGQSSLIRRWEEAFERVGGRVAQVLLTHADLADRTRANNARAALDELLAAGVVPIINENDTVAVDEIRFGDNDQLAALVAALVGADLLVLLSDVSGLLDHDGVRVSCVRDVEREALPLVRTPTGPRLGTGGMGSKLEAARRGTLAGAAVVIADARSETALQEVLAGADVGTLFVPPIERLAARKHWILFTLRPKGCVLVDAGAADALERRGGSLLAVGVLGVRGSFLTGDAVQVLDPHGREVARGLVRLSALDVARIAGRRAKEVEHILGRPVETVIHRDDLVVHGRRDECRPSVPPDLDEAELASSPEAPAVKATV